MITVQQIKAGLPQASPAKIDKYGSFLIETMIRFRIITPARICAFLAQIAHESGSFQYVRELASGKAYDTGSKAASLGNTPEADGDGEKYKGRGLIQITGTHNYKMLSEYFAQDFLNHPELLEEPKWACLSAGWFWDIRKLNEIADRDNLEAFKLITKRINGGLNGFDDRVARWMSIKQILS